MEIHLRLATEDSSSAAKYGDFPVFDTDLVDLVRDDSETRVSVNTANLDEGQHRLVLESYNELSNV